MTIEDVYRRYPTREEQEQFLLELLEQEERERVSPALDVFRPKSLGGERPEHKVIMGCRGGRGAGAKCLQIGTLVWMHDGSRRRVEDVRVGDRVMGPDSKPRLVLSTTRGVDRLYRIDQSAGMTYVVNRDHMLTLKLGKKIADVVVEDIRHSFKKYRGLRVSGDRLIESRINITNYGFGEYAGFTLNGDHRFLLDDGTITHNSWSLTSLIVQRAHYEEKPLRIMCLREIQRSLEESVYELVSKTVDRLGFKGWHKTKEYIQAPNGSRFLFRGLKDIMAANQVKGLEGFNIFFIEEAATISKESWDTLMPTLMRTPGAELWFAYNRENEVDPVDEKIWNRNRPDALLVELRPGRLDNPWWDLGGLQAEMDADFEFDPDEAEHIWYGQPRKQGQRSVLGRAAIRQAMSRVISDPEGQIQIGCDVARFGDDRTVAYMRKGMKTIAERVWSKQDTQTTAKALLDFADYDPSVLYAIDDTGVGGGVTDRLREEGRKVLAVNFGANARDRDRYVDTAAEMWFDFPLDDAEIPDDPELMSELSGRQYDFDKKGRRKLESKADYKKRLNRSPDKADALVLTYYNGSGQIFDDDMRTDMLAYRKMRGR